MKKRRWTDEQLTEACKTSTSIRLILIKLNLAPRGGSYKIIHNHIQRLKIDTEHFTGQRTFKRANPQLEP